MWKCYGMPGPLFARLLTPLPQVWSHECVLRLNTNAAWVKFPTCVKFLLIPLKRSSNLIPLLSPAVSGGRWRTCYLSELSAEERGRVETWKLFSSDSSTFWNCPSCCWCELLHVLFFFLMKADNLWPWPLLSSRLIINVLRASYTWIYSALKDAAKL